MRRSGMTYESLRLLYLYCRQAAAAQRQLDQATLRIADTFGDSDMLETYVIDAVTNTSNAVEAGNYLAELLLGERTYGAD